MCRGRILNNNQLNGTIPETLSQLQRLQFLFLQSNQLSGPIPDAFGELYNLQQMYVPTGQVGVSAGGGRAGRDRNVWCLRAGD